MPSKREGFGLVALEAVASGIPILASAESGFAELLFSPDILQVLGQTLAEECVAEVDGNQDTVCTDWSQRLQKLLIGLLDSFQRADTLRHKLCTILTWEKAAEQLVGDIRKAIVKH